MRYFQFKRFVKLKRKKPMAFPKAVIEFSPQEAWDLYKSILVPKASYSNRVISDFFKSFVASYEKFNIHHNLDSVP